MLFNSRSLEPSLARAWHCYASITDVVCSTQIDINKEIEIFEELMILLLFRLCQWGE
jgi:hypothetical protein